MTAPYYTADLDLRALIVARRDKAIRADEWDDRWYEPDELIMLTEGEFLEVAAFVAANDPASVVRNCDEDLAVLDRHRASPFHGSDDVCFWCTLPPRWVRYPCPDVQSIARRYVLTLPDGGAA